MTLQIKSLEDYEKQYARSVDNPGGFWAQQAESFTWRKHWKLTYQWDFHTPQVEWFAGGQLNITENCLDRHLSTRGDQDAIIWEPNDPNGEVRRYTYRHLHSEVCKCAHALKALGIGKGDRVCFYMPMIPELAIAVLACARIGAIHSVVFAGFSANALADRINDATCKMVICSDGNNRGGKSIPIKSVVDEALMRCPSIEKVLVKKHTGENITWEDDRDVDWDDIVPNQSSDCPAEVMDAEDTLFILYTSGSTGKPKGVVHSTAGYMVWTEFTFRNVFQYKDGDIYWCTADIGWITGHSYIIYGPLLAGATTMMFEGVPTWPDPGRFWQICEKHKVNIFYTAPTAIRALMAQGDDYVNRYHLGDLRTLGTVGEPINEAAWQWYHDVVGKGHCWVVDTWWQTETGGIMISGLSAITPMIPTYASLPLPGVQPVLVDKDGNELDGEAEGLLCVDFPWPGMLRTTWGDHERCRLNYFAQFDGKYFTGDGARRDAQGNFRIIGRVDDVINVSGHRIGTAEVENAINRHQCVVESAVVGYPHDIKGQGIYAYVICDGKQGDTTIEEIRAVVAQQIGPIAKPDKVQIVPGLPKTRSGKIMRRILRKIAEGDTSNLGDTSTLLDPSVVEDIMQGRV